jgi:hypothetical protein
MSRWWLLLCLMFAPSAWAGTFYLEAPAVPEKADATALAEAAQGQGQASRVVRRYRKGAGWEYVVVIEGFADQAAATAAAGALAGKTGKPITVFETMGDEARAVSVEAPAAAASSADDERTPEQIAAGRILEAAVKAHGGAPGGLAVVQKAEAVKFEFRRTVPGGPTVKHVYAERGSDRFLEVVIEKGTGTSSKSGVAQGKGWLAAGSAQATLQDTAQTATELDRFAPEAVLAFPLGFASAVTERKEFQSLVPAGGEQVDGEACEVLRYDGGRAGTPLTLYVGDGDHRVRKVVFGSDAGDVIHEFSDWKELAPGVVLPRRIRTWRGTELIDDVEVLGIDLHPKLPDDWFRAPGA